MAVIQATS